MRNSARRNCGTWKVLAGMVANMVVGAMCGGSIVSPGIAMKPEGKAEREERAEELAALRWRSMDKECREKILGLFRNEPSMRELSLLERHVEDSTAIEIGKALEVNTVLMALDLGVSIFAGDNRISAEGGKAIAEALTHNTTLTSLNLGYNRIGNAGAVAMGEALEHNTTLMELNLEENQIGTPGGLMMGVALSRNTTLTSICLFGNSIDDCKMQEINAFLARNRMLTAEVKLDLSEMNLGDKQALAIAAALKSNTTLRWLNLGGNQIKGGKAIGEALRVNTTLTWLNLEGNPIRNEGAMAIYRCIGGNTTLTKLGLSGVGREVLLFIGGILRRNNALAAFKNSGLPWEVFENFEEKTWPTLLQLHRGESLRKLSLKNFSQTSQGAKILVDLALKRADWEKLDLEGNSIGYAEVVAIGETLKTNTTLTELNLAENQMGAAGARVIANALCSNENLLSLGLSSNLIHDEGATAIGDALKVNTTLTELSLDRGSIGNSGGAAIGDALKVNATLGWLGLSQNRIGDAAAMVIGEAIRVNTVLVRLNLAKNPVEKKGRRAIVNALETNSTLTRLDLDDSPVRRK